MLMQGVSLQNAVRIKKKTSRKYCENMFSLFSNLLGDIWKWTKSILRNICAGVYYYKTQCASQQLPGECNNMFSELLGLCNLERGAVGSTKCLLQGCVTTKCSAHGKRHPEAQRNSEHGFFEFAWDLSSGEKEHEPIYSWRGCNQLIQTIVIAYNRG